VTVAADYSFGYTNFLGFAVDFCRAGGEIVERFWVPLGQRLRRRDRAAAR
jgi:branched-chain amino acid transport system substrate-binding protein